MGGPVTSAVAGAGAAAAVARRAQVEPGGVALEVDGGAVLTNGAWEAGSNAVARGLVARGVRAGDRVGLLFDAARWTDFAVAHLGVVKAGARPALFSPGASPPDLARALAHAALTGLLCASGLEPAPCPVWTAHVPEVADRGGDGAVPPSPERFSAPDDLVYPPAPLAPPDPVTCRAGDPVEVVDGWLAHAWAPGSAAGRLALQIVQAAPGSRAVALATFDADRLCGVMAERGAAACGLTPALASGLLASGAAARHDLSSVAAVLVSGSPRPQLLADLGKAFPSAVVGAIPDRDLATAGSDPPVAVSQEGMLWHECFVPGSFNLPCLVRRYRGPLDVDVFAWAMSELVRRHQPLRSTFSVTGGRAGQVLGDGGSAALAAIDMSGLDPADRDTEVAQMLASASGRPFDLASGPLFEPSLVRLGPDDHLLVVRLHHTVFDDWSVDVFRRELSALYTARLAGAPSPLAEPSITFAAHCRRQRIRLDGDDGAAQRAWWRQELEGAPLAVQLPVGQRGGAEPGEPLRLDLPPELAAAVRRVAPTLRATPFMTVLAAFSVLLGRLTGQDDLVISTVVAHRNRSELEPLVGCFTKKVPLRLRLHGQPTFPELVARTRSSLLGALSHQDLAFDAAVQEGLGRPAAEHGVVPQVSVVFQGETPQQVKLALAGLTAGPYEVRAEARRERHFTQTGTGEEPPADAWGDGIYLGTFLILSLLETADGMALVARGVFDRAEGRRLLEDFRSLLEQVVADPSGLVSQLGPAAAAPPPAAEVVDLRGFRASRSRLEAALGRCPGVAEAAVAVRDDPAGERRLVAYVVPAAVAGALPTLTALRRAVWEALPGAPWPSVAVAMERLPRRPDGGVDLAGLPAPPLPVTDADADTTLDPVAGLLTAMWGEAAARPVTAGTSYWQDFSFLQVLAEAREAGLVLTDEQVVRSRTPEMLAATLNAAAAAPARR